MSDLVRAVRDRARNWIGSDASWSEHLAVIGTVAAAAGLLLFATGLPTSQQVVLWAALLLSIAFLFRRGWLTLFGPVLFYELVRTARRTRFVVIRTLYAGLLAVILCWMFFAMTMRGGWSIPSSEMSMFATSFFYTFVGIQFVTVVVLTPAYTAGAISEEKERRTLEFLLATDLLNREIVFGKLAARILNLTLLLLAGLPILSFLQFIGGVDPGLVLAAFAATLLTMWSLAGLSILNSVMCRRARDAIVLTYLGFLAYYLIALGSLFVYIPPLGLVGQPTWSPIKIDDIADWINTGNVGYAVYQFGFGRRTVVLDEELPRVLREYAVFHGLVGLVTLVLAVRKLRVVALGEHDVKSPRKAVLTRSVVPKAAYKRPKIGNYPMIWKEVFAEGGLRLNAMGRVVMGVLVVASFLPILIIAYMFFDKGMAWWSGWERVTEAINYSQLRFVGTTVLCLLLLAIVVRAAGSVCGEREKDTLDALLTSPMRAREILFGKWVGSILSVRWGAAWAALIYLIGGLTGSLAPYSVPLIIVSWFVYAAGFAGIGLYFSIGSKSTLRATVASLMTAIFVAGGHWLVSGMCCFMPLAWMNPSGRVPEGLAKLLFGQTPPLVLGLFAFHGSEWRDRYGSSDIAEMTASSLFGVGLWAIATVGLWFLVLKRFRDVTGRSDVLRPERTVPRPRAILVHPLPRAETDPSTAVTERP